MRSLCLSVGLIVAACKAQPPLKSVTHESCLKGYASTDCLRYEVSAEGRLTFVATTSNRDGQATHSCDYGTAPEAVAELNALAYDADGKPRHDDPKGPLPAELKKLFAAHEKAAVCHETSTME